MKIKNLIPIMICFFICVPIFSQDDKKIRSFPLNNTYAWKVGLGAGAAGAAAHFLILKNMPKIKDHVLASSVGIGLLTGLIVRSISQYFIKKNNNEVIRTVNDANRFITNGCNANNGTSFYLVFKNDLSEIQLTSESSFHTQSDLFNNKEAGDYLNNMSNSYFAYFLIGRENQKKISETKKSFDESWQFDDGIKDNQRVCYDKDKSQWQKFSK